MASVEEEMAKRYELMKKLNPWMAISFLEARIAEKDELIRQLRAEIDNWPMEYEVRIYETDSR